MPDESKSQVVEQKPESGWTKPEEPVADSAAEIRRRVPAEKPVAPER